MKKLIPYIIGVIVAVQATTPPLEFSVNFTNSPVKFVWTFLLFGILSLYFVFTKANIFLKILLPYLFINSFLSSMVHLSMTTFIYVVVGAYFYLLCLECDDWRPVFRILACILLLESMLFLLWRLDAETLLNFGKGSTSCFGSVGNPMQFKSMIMILLAFLVLSMQSIKRHIKWIYALIIPACIYIAMMPKFWSHLFYARGHVWLETFRLFLGHAERNMAWLIGWGIGTFKAIFPAMARGHFELEGVWQNAHNEPIEFLMEGGIIGFIPFALYMAFLLRGCRNLELLGSLMIIYTLCFYFPMHQPHTSLLLVAFAAYREQQIRGERWLQSAN